MVCTLDSHGESSLEFFLDGFVVVFIRHLQSPLRVDTAGAGCRLLHFREERNTCHQLESTAHELHMKIFSSKCSES